MSQQFIGRFLIDLVKFDIYFSLDLILLKFEYLVCWDRFGIFVVNFIRHLPVNFTSVFDLWQMLNSLHELILVLPVCVIEMVVIVPVVHKCLNVVWWHPNQAANIVYPL